MKDAQNHHHQGNVQSHADITLQQLEWMIPKDRTISWLTEQLTPCRRLCELAEPPWKSA